MRRRALRLVRWGESAAGGGEVGRRAAEGTGRRAETTNSSFFLLAAVGVADGFGFPIRTVWPSGLRRRLKAPVCGSAGSTPAAVVDAKSLQHSPIPKPRPR
jgi:hypothetical protein